MDIKFKGKRIDNGEWVEGSLRQEGEFAYILSDNYSIVFDEPEYHVQGMGCGVEDRCITDRYDACRYGWDEAVERYAEMFPKWLEVDPATVEIVTPLYKAAEAMYDALKDMAKWLNDDGIVCDLNAWGPIIKAALALAEGRSE